MKPQNVIAHEHYFAYLDKDGIPIDVPGDILGRYDACDTRDDGAGVWSPSSGTWWPAKDFEQARHIAKHMARTYAQYHPLN